MKYRYDRLSNNRQSTPVTVVFHVDIEDQPSMQYSKTMIVRSVNDCPLLVVNEEETINTKFTMATFVNEQHPLIDSMLQEATERGTIDQFLGYQENDPQAVVRQIYALWDLLVARGASYSHDLTTSPISRNVSGRQVSLIEETINSSHASSVDGRCLWFPFFAESASKQTSSSIRATSSSASLSMKLVAKSWTGHGNDQSKP